MKDVKVAIIMGSDSDLEVMSEAAKILEEFGVGHEVSVVSAHRTPDALYEFASSARKRGIEVIIAGAGGAAHLPGMTASMTELPVIGVPIKTKTMDGLDSLLSIAQMPPGIPVATMAINGAKNAGILAVSMLGIADKNLLDKVADYKKKLNVEVKMKNENLGKLGYKAYLENK
ncbi:MAG: 5-(carboxyamino)imidazole ribonucleotide mutase [bacterium]